MFKQENSKLRDSAGLTTVKSDLIKISSTTSL